MTDKWEVVEFPAVINDKPIGGFDQLIKIHNEGKLKNINVSE